VLEWAERGRIAEADLPRALALAGVLPSRDAWRRFLDRLSLWMGTVLVAAALIFFLASNWDDLGRFAKFGLAEALVVVALAVVWRLGLDRPSGKAALLGASLFLGALLALIGQTYQTGADTFELFAAWAAMILPWVLVSRFTPLWLVWLALVDTAIVLYFQALPSIFGVLLTTDRMLWALFAFNTAALAVWEAVAASVWAVPVWLVWLAAAWAVYRRPVKDVFVLAGGVLSVIVVVAIFLGKQLSDSGAGAYLLIGLIVIALSAAGGWWLKNVAGEDEG